MRSLDDQGQTAWERVAADSKLSDRIVSRSSEQPRTPKLQELPERLSPALIEALMRNGISSLYRHQVSSYLTAQERSLIVTSGTASGKSLCFNLPVLDHLTKQPKARALYLYPTKALAQDQARSILKLGMPGAQPGIYDGDTETQQRQHIRKHANILMTNPDMLHVGILPHHQRWAELFSQLNYVVIDEAHVYRGVFGSHVANVLRRLRRVANAYGSDPNFILTSATLQNPLQLAVELTGITDTVLIEEDSAPRAGREILLMNPPLIDREIGNRVSALSEAADLLTKLMRNGVRTICFIKSRKGVELITRTVRERLHGANPELVDMIAPYRGGYTVDQRRDLEKQLTSGELLAVVATDALELGIDIGDLDCAICATFPGTVASLRQMWGRAGRRSKGLAVFIAGDDALDQFFCRHPEQFLARPCESAILNHSNRQIYQQHVLCAALEAPLTAEDKVFLGDALAETTKELVEGNQLRVVGNRHVLAAAERYPAAEVSLRATEPGPVTVVEQKSGEILGTAEYSRALHTLHQGAVYIHLGESYRVLEFDLDRRVAVLAAHNENYYTQAKRETNIWIQSTKTSHTAMGCELHFGEIEITEHVVAYKRKQLSDHKIIDHQSLSLPPSSYQTQALWYVLSEELLTGTVPTDQLLGALHAAEHAQIAVLPLLAMCDRWDIGGLSTNFHPQTDQPTIFIYDGFPGGIGISRCGFERFDQLLDAASTLIAECGCSDGCPSCVQSPKCGNLNEPLSKNFALSLMQKMKDFGQ